MNESQRKVRLCIVCGARVTNINPKTNTCGALCTRAKKSGRTRDEQELADIEYAKRMERLGCWSHWGSG